MTLVGIPPMFVQLPQPVEVEQFEPVAQFHVNADTPSTLPNSSELLLRAKTSMRFAFTDTGSGGRVVDDEIIRMRCFVGVDEIDARLRHLGPDVRRSGRTHGVHAGPGTLVHSDDAS
jgi:hypothetical protein